MRNLIAIIRLILLIIHTFLTVFISSITNVILPYKFHSIILGNWYKFVLWLFNFRIEINGNIPKNLGILVVSNHCSYMDVMVIASAIPAHFTPKSNIKKWPIIGQMVNVSLPIYINRTNIRTLPEQNQKVTKALNNGRNIVIYPEGTTNNGSEVYRFKSGAFSFLSEEPSAKDIAVQPVSIVYSQYNNTKLALGVNSPVAWFGDEKLLPHIWKMLKTHTCIVQLTFLPQVYLKDFASRKDLALHCEEIIRSSLYENIEKL